MAKGSSKFKHWPSSPRGRALEAIDKGGDANPAGDVYDAYQEQGFEDVPSWYDPKAGVPRSMTKGDSKPDLNPSPFTANAMKDATEIPYTTGKE